MFEIFKTFSKEEFAFFGEYLKTEYFNGSVILLKLYNNMLDFPDLDKQKIINSVVENGGILGKPMNEHVVVDYYYKLIKKAREFLSFKRFYFDEYYKNEMLLNELDERNVEKSFLKLYKEMYLNVTKENDSTTKYYRLYSLNEKLFNFTERNFHILKHNNTFDRLKSIHQCSQYKAIYCFIEEVSIYAVYIMNVNVYNIKSDDPELFKSEYIQTLYSAIEQKENHPLLVLYYKLYMSFSNINDITLYSDYKKYFVDINHKIHLDEVKHHFQFLIKYCTLKKTISEEKDFFQSELMDLYKIFLENKFFQFDGEIFIQTRLLLNIIKIFKRSGNMKWIIEFMGKNGHIVNPKDRKNIKHFLNAYHYYSLSDFKSALSEINKINIDNFSYKYDVQTLKIRLLYSLGGEYIESALSNILSFKAIIKKDEFYLPELKRKTLNFLKYLERLIKTTSASKLIYDTYRLEKDNDVYFKEWLLSEYKKALK